MSNASTSTRDSINNQPFSKVVRIGSATDEYSKHIYSTFCKIEYSQGRLSITGVEGPLGNGNAIGSCGQIDKHIKVTTFGPDWNTYKLAQFVRVWGAWHLNDMHAYDSEMHAAGWDELARKEIYKHEFSLSSELYKTRRAIEADALVALRKGETFTPTADEARIASMPLSVTLYDYAETISPPQGYEYGLNVYSKPMMRKTKGEKKTLGWVTPKEHEDGLLGRKLREGGNGYGSAWYAEEVPAEVLEFLQALPNTDVIPAWV